MATAAKIALVKKVTKLINDTDNDIWTFDEVEAALDNNRVELRYVQADTVKSVASGGTVTYKIFTAPFGYTHFDDNVALYDYNYDAASPNTSDNITARWEYTNAPTRPIYILGWSYDIYGAAYDLLIERGSQLSEEVQSFSAAQGAYTLAEKRRGPLELAQKYLARSRKAVQVSEVIRTDVNVLTW